MTLNTNAISPLCSSLKASRPDLVGFHHINVSLNMKGEIGFYDGAIYPVHLCLIAKLCHAAKAHRRGNSHFSLVICLQWEPDVFGDDMKLMSMALSAHLRGAGINSFRLSMSGI